MAAKPSSASSASINEYAGRIAVLRRITDRRRLDSTAVMACGYMNRASAEPNASVAYAQYVVSPAMNVPVGAFVVGLVFAICVFAPSNIGPKPILVAT